MSSPVISIRNNFPQVISKINQVGEQVGNRAMVRAINATMVQGRTAMARQISQEFRVSVGTARERLKVSRASTSGGGVRIVASLEATRKGKGRSMNLIAFVTRGRVSKASARRSGRADLAGQLQFQIKRAGGKKSIKGAFVANQGRTVFVRKGRERLPIKALNTIDIGQMFNTRRVNGVVRQVMLDRFEVNFSRELRAVLEGFAR